jgi:8-oxo-dGTP pyrophosphatase MutT (NUDIX family)
MKKWQNLSSKIVYQNPWIKVLEDKVIRPDKREGIYGYLIKPVGVFVLPVDTNGTIYLIHQFRYPIKKYIYEIPGGVVNKNETLLQNAKRELKEETGITAKSWKRIGSYYAAAGHETTKMVVYLATNIDISNYTRSLSDGDEIISKIIKLDKIDLIKMIKTGKISCGITLAAISLWLSQ